MFRERAICRVGWEAHLGKVGGPPSKGVLRSALGHVRSLADDEIGSPAKKLVHFLAGMNGADRAGAGRFCGLYAGHLSNHRVRLYSGGLGRNRARAGAW